MPVLLFTAQEVFVNARNVARQSAEQILKLSDLEKEPLIPGETPDTRRHQIAKLGKQLAEAFLVIDDIMLAQGEALAEQMRRSGHAPPLTTDKPDDDPGKGMN